LLHDRLDALVPRHERLLLMPSPARVALETTLLLHGVPREAALPLFRELTSLIRAQDADPCLIGVIDGKPIVGMTEAQLESMLHPKPIPKPNTANLGLALARNLSGATTVSSTMELAARAGIRLFATGGIGGIHQNFADHLDISSDLIALTRFPVA